MCIENLTLSLEKPSGILWKQSLKEFLDIRSVINFYTKALDLAFIGQIKFSQNFDTN